HISVQIMIAMAVLGVQEAREAPPQQSRRRYAANGFASVPRTMPPLLNKEKKSASYGGCRTGSEGRWATVFSRQCDWGSIRPRAVALVRITSCMPQPQISKSSRRRPLQPEFQGSRPEVVRLEVSECPLWVNHRRMSTSCPLYPRKQTLRQQLRQPKFYIKTENNSSPV